MKIQHLTPMMPYGGAGLGRAELDVGAQGVQRHATFAVRLVRGHFGAAEAARACGRGCPWRRTSWRSERLLHGAAEGDAALELGRDVLGDELRVGLGLADLLDVDEHLVLGEPLRGLALSCSTPLPPLPMTMPGREVWTIDLGLVGGALDLDAGDARVGELLAGSP